MRNERRVVSRALAGLLACLLCAAPGLASAAEVSGAWMSSGDKDVAKAFEGVKARGWVSAYYNQTVTNTINGAAVSGRAFNQRNRSIGVELVEIELEKIPEKGGAGFKLDLAAGDAMDTIQSGVTTLHGSGSLTTTDRNFQHATVSYLADIGNGLRIDAGKMVTHIGAESIEGIKNNNFSHSYGFTYAIPFQQTGVRLSYPVNANITADLHVHNGWNTTIDNDKGKSFSPSLGFVFGPVSGTLNYMGGLESDGATTPVGSRATWRHLFDGQVWYGAGPLNLGVAFDYGNQRKIVFGTQQRTAKWYGGALYARYKVNDKIEPALRVEKYVDPDNFSTAQTTTFGSSTATQFYGCTLTVNVKAAPGLLIRPEVRYDKSNRRTDLFRTKNNGQGSGQATGSLNAVYYF